MLKYAMALCFSSFFNSAPDHRLVNSYKGLVLIQTFPITRVFYEEVFRQYIRERPIQLAKYLSEHWMVYEEHWVIDRILTYDADNNYIWNCVNARGNQMQLNRSLLDDNLKHLLKVKWPTLAVDGDDVEKWAIHYHDHGSCITEDALKFFKESLELLKKYDVGNILRPRINPGNKNQFDLFLERISFAVGAKVYVDCIDSQDGQKQYISEVWICLNKDRKPVDCQHRRDPSKIHNCKTNEFVEYPLVPAGYY